MQQKSHGKSTRVLVSCAIFPPPAHELAVLCVSGNHGAKHLICVPAAGHQALYVVWDTHLTSLSIINTNDNTGVLGR